jgi:hypothetical protein
MSQKATIHIGTLYTKPEYTDALIKSFLITLDIQPLA